MKNENIGKNPLLYNYIEITGIPDNDLEIYSLNGKEAQYKFSLLSQRLSGIVDKIPIIMKKSLILKMIYLKKNILIQGKVSTANNYILPDNSPLFITKNKGLVTQNGIVVIPDTYSCKELDHHIYDSIKEGKIKSKLSTRVIANNVINNEEGISRNCATVEGIIVGKQQLRTNLLCGKKIIDFKLANNNNYIPTLAWGAGAEMINSAPEKAKILVENSRLQSRTYTKPNDDKIYSVVELSAGKVTILEN